MTVHDVEHWFPTMEARLQIIDCSSGIAGGYCAKVLGDAGGEVVKVESEDGDPLRRWTSGGYWSGKDPRGEALFRYLHHGHQSIVTEDIDDFLAGADVLIVDDNSALDPIELAARHARLVVASISPFGLSGPYAGRPATEFTLQAESDALAIRGHVSRPPIQAGGRTIEWVSGLYAAVGALAATRVVREGGPGEFIDVSMSEVANTTATTAFDLMDSLLGRPTLKAPARAFETPSIEPTADGYVGFNTNTRVQFDSFMLMLGRADLVESGEWAPLASRQRRWDEWNALVHEWTTAHSTDDIVARAVELRVPVAPVADGPAVLELEQAIARDVFQGDPSGHFQHPRRPWRIDGEGSQPLGPSPRLGEHRDTARARPAKPAPNLPARLPLEGVKVLDLTAWWAGPSASAMFANLGADVIHVESVSRPDGLRLAVAGHYGRESWWDYSALFLATNANKRGLTLDLTTDQGRDLALRLVASCDVVMENYTPRVLDQFQLGWDVVKATNPRSVMVRMPAFGLDGPWRDRPGFAQTMEQVTGLAWLTGHLDDQPRIQRGPCDPNSGLHAVIGALVALEHRDRTGEGCLVESTMFEAALNISAELVIEWTAYGNRLEREGNRSPWAAPQGLYATNREEEWLALSVANDDQWTALVGALGDPHWAKDPSFATHAGRRASHDVIDRHLAMWSRSTDLSPALEMLQRAGVPAAPAVDPRRTSEHPQYQARRYYEALDHPIAGRHLHPGVPFRYASVDRWLHTAAPTMGQHNVEILGELGCSDEDIAALEAAHVIGTRPLNL